MAHARAVGVVFSKWIILSPWLPFRQESSLLYTMEQKSRLQLRTRGYPNSDPQEKTT